MALAPVSLLSVPYEDYPGQFLKFFNQGTTTPLSMATDAGGLTTLAKAEISSGGAVPIGFIKTAGDAIFIPFVNGAYDAWIFPTAAEADANDTSNAVQIADDIDADPTDIVESGITTLPNLIVSASQVNYEVDNNFTGGGDRTQEKKNADIVSIADFGPTGGGANDSVAIQAAINASDHILVNADYSFSAITITGEKTFYGTGTLSGLATSGSKPTEVALVAAANAAAREALIDGYYNGVVNTGATSIIQGHLRLADCVVKDTSAEFEVIGQLTLADVAFYGIGYSCKGSGYSSSDSGMLIIDAPIDGVFMQHGGSCDIPSCVVLFSGDRSGHIQLGGVINAAGGSFRFSLARGGIRINVGGNFACANGNISDNWTSGISTVYDGGADIEGCTINNNGVSGTGAGIVCESKTGIFAVGVTITNNAGAGIDCSFDGIVQATSSTITGNDGYAARARTGGEIMLYLATIDRTNRASAGNAAPMLFNQGTGIIYTEPPSDGSGGKTALNDDDYNPLHNELEGRAFIGKWEAHEDIAHRANYFAHSAVAEAAVIAAGVITITSGRVEVDTEAFAATDDLDTINGVKANQLVMLGSASSTRDPTVKHGTGNVRLAGGVDFTFTTTRDRLVLEGDGSELVEISRATNP